MRITGRDGVWLALRPLGWQFPAGTGPWDDDWLVVEIQVAGDGPVWAFTDPCLLIDEARELAGWLRAAARGTLAAEPQPDPLDSAWEPSLTFLEPVLGFSFERRDESGIVIAAYVDMAGAPPGPDATTPAAEDPRQALRLRTDAAALERAAGEWERELAALPARTSPPRW